MMIIQDLKPKDIHVLTELQPEGWSDIVERYKFYTRSDFCFPIKAIIDDKIIGIGSSIIHNDVSWLGHIIVHRDYRNKGIGKLVTQTLVDRSIAMKCETIQLIATDLGAMVYERLGFETETEYLFYKDLKEEEGWILADNISPFTENLKGQIAAIDKEVSGEDRLCNLSNYLQNGYVYQEGNVVKGYFLPDFGDGLIIALTPSAGIQLMKLRLKTHHQASFPIDNLGAIEFMSQHNYKPFKQAKRMSLGKKRKVLLASIYNRIGGNLG